MKDICIRQKRSPSSSAARLRFVWNLFPHARNGGGAGDRAALRHPKVDLVGRPSPKQILCGPWRSRQKPRGDD